MPSAETIDPGFSTADTDRPSIAFAGDTLTLSFLDWREQSIRVVFRDVTRFGWTNEPGDHFHSEPYDGTCVVRDSRWPPDIANTKCGHYRLDFNICGGRLDVACESFAMETLSQLSVDQHSSRKIVTQRFSSPVGEFVRRYSSSKCSAAT